ncbi:MAG: MoxR family ATPase [Ruminococcus sp.]|uniref:AAA family ATPase n=2 Tax=Ruminococcus TaxID=1263 RepID=UPI0025849608|nr:MoxR family ATPase [Ruminococcus sp.]MDD5889305.1 MoxR family ATPase [Ruminococcus sp.]
MSEFEKIVSEIKKVINGKESAIRIILCTILANENVLIEDIPGTGKTTLVKAFSKVLQLTSKRIQMTSDTLPSDITGYSIYNKEMGKFEFIKGPVFCNILLADELNRTSGRTQSALLEAMEEHQVTVDGKTYKLDEPFSVIATQNPYGYVGTQQLPQAQLDRFSVKISLGYPSVDEEVNILLNRRTENPLDKLDYVISKKEFEDMQNSVKEIFVNESIARYIATLVNITRNSNYVECGGSPRVMVSVMNLSKAVAFSHNRNYVIPEDVKEIFVQAVSHRITLKKEYKGKVTSESLMKNILSTTVMPGVQNA